MNAAALLVSAWHIGISPYGCWDMVGKVSEWVSDWRLYQYYHNVAPKDPQGPSLGENKVLCGGSWFMVDQSARAASTDSRKPHYRDFHMGFRCAIQPIH